jgi:hypothetical protein
MRNPMCFSRRHSSVAYTVVATSPAAGDYDFDRRVRNGETDHILLAQESYCPDDRTTSDHRPVRTVFHLDAGG